MHASNAIFIAVAAHGGEGDQRGADAVFTKHSAAGPGGGHEHHRAIVQEAGQGEHDVDAG